MVVNWKRGVKRITWFLAVIGGVMTAFLICPYWDVFFGEEFGLPLGTPLLVLFGMAPGFLVTWIIYWVARWIIRGFRVDTPKKSWVMKRKQEIVLCVGIAIVVLMTMFPPVFYETHTLDDILAGYKRGQIHYCFLFTDRPKMFSYSRWCLQSAIVLFATAGLMAILKDKQDRARSFRRIAPFLGLGVAILSITVSAEFLHSMASGAHGNLQLQIERKKKNFVEGFIKQKRSEMIDFVPDDPNWVEQLRQVAQNVKLRELAQAEWERKKEADAELKKLEKGFWVSLSRVELVVVYTLVCSVVAVVSFCGVWLVCKLLLKRKGLEEQKLTEVLEKDKKPKDEEEQ